jgi:carbamoyl-phosphate synthase small subunit
VPLGGKDLASVVSTKKVYEWKEPSWRKDFDDNNLKIVAIDFGVKHNILRMLKDRGFKVIVVPAKTTAAEIMAMKPDGVFLSNGPGDPEPCKYAIECIKELRTKRIPMFGICLGHQLLGLALGMKTIKMKFGHHGANHPVKDLDSNRVFITSQNHGFTIDSKSIPEDVKITHLSLFDETIQGIETSDKRCFSFQGHPEASPGPQEIQELFDKFLTVVKSNAKKK